jgi:hypothetical protein
MKEEHLQKLLAEYTFDKYEQNRIYIQKQEDQNKFKVVYNPVTATTVTYMWTKEQILQNLDFIDKVIDNLKDKEYHVVELDKEEDGYVIPASPFKKNKNKHKNKHKSPKKTTKKHKKSPKKRSKLSKKTPKKSLKRVQRKH